jgi:hypothetical protein
MTGFPFPGDHIGAFVVESATVSHHRGSAGSYRYDVHLVLHGPGGQQGVRRALKPLLAQHPTTFSGYGNSYQLWFDKPEIESLGNGRYAVQVEGGGARTYLEDDLQRFLEYLAAQGMAIVGSEPAAQSKEVQAYLDQYRAEVKRLVGRYRYQLRKHERQEAK